MLSSLKPSPADPILQIMAEFQADPRPNKIDLGVGVYKDDAGATVIPRAVKTAEARILESQDTKSYLGLLGDVGYAQLMSELVLGGAAPSDRISAIQTTGGSGALYILLSLARQANPDATIWASTPTWDNHHAMAEGLGLKTRSYAYFNPQTRAVEVDRMMDDLKAAGPNDVVLLHGCCHNPTGANLTLADWKQVTEMALAQGFLPMIDIAYQGFGDGLDEDAAGLRHMAARVPEMLIATSCSKNFALYRDRTGCAIVLSGPGKAQVAARANLMTLMRITYSMPPDHGAAVVRTILTDPALRNVWEGELAAMRTRMLSLRQSLSNAMRVRTNSDRFDFVADHRGMFSLIGATPEHVAQLRDEFAIYIVGDGRLNIAGLREERMDEVADAFATIGI